MLAGLEQVMRADVLRISWNLISVQTTKSYNCNVPAMNANRSRKVVFDLLEKGLQLRCVWRHA